jgi:3-isopropylmalate dehydrogenase
MADKSNAMRFVGDLWQRTFAEVSREYPAIESSTMYIDALCMQVVKDPSHFEVIVTNNMFGDIVTDLAATLQGGLGMAASGNIHPGRVSISTGPRLRAQVRRDRPVSLRRDPAMALLLGYVGAEGPPR